MGSKLLERHFRKEKTIVKRNAIRAKLLDLADKDSDIDVDDFLRFFILIVFNCVIFPVSNCATPRFIFPYLDDLDTFFDYAWGNAAYRFLREDILEHLGHSKKKAKRKKYLDGCLVGLMAWVYERVPCLGKPRVLRCLPRLFKYESCNIPVTAEAAELLLESISSNKIVFIEPLEDEKILVGNVERYSTVNSQSVVAESSALVKRLENEIKSLKEKYATLEGLNSQLAKNAHGLVGGKVQITEHSESDSMGYGNGNAGDNESAGGLDLGGENFNMEMGYDAEEGNEDEGGNKDEELKKYVEANKVLDEGEKYSCSNSDDEGKKDSSLQKDEENKDEGGNREEELEKDEELDKDEAAKEILEGDKYSSSNSDEEGNKDSSLEEDEENKDKGGNRDEELDKDEAAKEILEGEKDSSSNKDEVNKDEDGSKNIDSSDGGGDNADSERKKVGNPISSIARSVMTRDDRLRKRKDPDFTTPPRTTPKRKRKRLPAVIKGVVENVDLDDIDIVGIASNAVEETVHKYSGRRDYSGCDQISMEDKNIIETYLSGGKLGCVVWQDADVYLNGDQLLRCLFDEDLRSDLMHAYFHVLSSNKENYGHKIFCMSPNVQSKVLLMLEDVKNKNVKDKDFGAFMSNLSKSARNKLSELNHQCLQRYKYILFPICYKNHWFLLIFNPSEKNFTLKDSLSSPYAKGAAKVYAKFVAGYLRNVLNRDYGKGFVFAMKSRQQGNDLNCGVFTCLWGECFLRDDPAFWKAEESTSIDVYRSHIVAVILSDERGMLGKG